MKSDKALTQAELELTQKLQMYFPWGDIDPAIVQAWNGCPRKLITERVRKAFGEMPSINMLLKRTARTTIMVATEPFIVRDCLVVDTSRKALVKISYVGDNIEKWFFGKTEEPFAQTDICYYELLKDSVDEPIITELGGKEKVAVTLAEIYSLMRNQRNGDKGILLNNGSANIFYVRDVNCALRAVCVRWLDDGWDLSAHSVEDPSRWLAGDRVFSRNSFTL